MWTAIRSVLAEFGLAAPVDLVRDPVGTPRAPGWAKLALEWLEANPKCAACGRTEGCVPHHVVPVHVKPEFELSPTNLLTLCPKCHLVIGHGGNWKHWNVYAAETADRLRRGIVVR